MRLKATLVLLCVLFVAIAAVPGVVAENAAPAADPLARYNVPLDLGPQSGELSLTLEEAINLSLRNNLGVESYRYALKSAGESVEMQDAAFDPVFFANIPWRREKSVSMSTGTETWVSEIGYDFGFRKRFRTGTFASIQLTDNFLKYSAPSDVSRATLVMAVSQPLLRNSGTAINTAQIELAENTREMAMLDIEHQITSLIHDVTSAYWSLALSRDKLEVALQGKELAIELYRTTENLVRSGAETQLALLRAESGVAAREESVHLATMGLRASEDYLKMLLNLNRNGSIPDTRVLLTDSPNREPEACEFDECINFALTRRPDLRKARVGIAMAKIGLDVAKDQLRPKLDLSAAIALTGMGPNYGDNWEGLGRTDYYSFSLGFDLELPLGNRSARASVKKAEYDMQRSKVGVLAAEQGVILQVRNAIRQVRTNFRRIQSADVSAQLAERSLREEEARYRVGRSTPIEVLRFQTDLIAARNALLQAVIDYNISISALNEARGSSLLERRINLDELMEPGISVPEWNGASTGRMVPAGE